MSFWICVERLIAHILWCALLLLAMFLIAYTFDHGGWWWLAVPPTLWVAFQILDSLIMTKPLSRRERRKADAEFGQAVIDMYRKMGP